MASAASVERQSPATTSPSGAAPSTRRTEILLALLMLVLPAIFFDWALPFVSDTTLGNDYQLFSIPQQMELQFSIANGSFPLFVPGFAGGQSVQALVQGQPYHPLSLLVPHMPGYWTGHAVECNTLVRLLSLGLAHLALFIFLRRLGLGRGFAFLLALVTTYNMRMLDLFRYGAALESWTGHLFLCAFLGLFFLRRSSLGVRAGIIVSAYWLITCGHPQMAYYGFLGAVLFALLLPFIAAAIDQEKRVPLANIVRFWASAAGLVVVGILLSADFIVPFVSEYLAGTPRSVAGQHFAWALAWQDSWLGTLNNLFVPLRSDVHGAFGGSSLVVLAALLPMLLFLRVKVPAAVWMAWALAVVVFLALQGDRTPVYWVLWRYLPLASPMRAPGRLALLLPILLMSVLAWLFARADRSTQATETDARREGPTFLAVAALLMSISYLVVLSRVAVSPSEYSPVSIHHVSGPVEVAAVGLGLATLFLFALLARLPRWRGGLLVAMCVFVCLESKLVLDNGTWKDPSKRTPTFSEMANQKREKLGFRFASGEASYSAAMWRQTTMFHVDPSLGRVYYQWRAARDMEDAYRILGQGVNPDEVVVEGVDGEVSIPSSGDNSPVGRTKLVHSSFNRLVFDVESSRRAYFTLSYPYTGRWIALVDGVAAPTHRANGGNYAVPIPSVTARSSSGIAARDNLSDGRSVAWHWSSRQSCWSSPRTAQSGCWCARWWSPPHRRACSPCYTTVCTQAATWGRCTRGRAPRQPARSPIWPMGEERP
jgi:hypothetical protein